MQANNITNRKEYYEYVNEFVDILLEDLELESSTDPHYDVSMSIDSDHMVMMYSNNLTVLENSDEQPDEWKHFVDESDDYRKVIQAMAYDVFRQDVWAEIYDRDIDI